MLCAKKVFFKTSSKEWPKLDWYMRKIPFSVFHPSYNKSEFYEIKLTLAALSTILRERAQERAYSNYSNAELFPDFFDIIL